MYQDGEQKLYLQPSGRAKRNNQVKKSIDFVFGEASELSVFRISAISKVFQPLISRFKWYPMV